MPPKSQKPKKQEFSKVYKEFIEVLSSEVETIQEEKKSWEQQKETFKKMDLKDTEVINLNVGGQKFSTTMSTVRQKINGKDNFFTTMFSGNFDVMRDEKKRFFIDRDGSHFKYILNYLRAGGDMDYVVFPVDKMVLKELQLEFEYYEIDWPEIFQNPSSLLDDDELEQINKWTGYSGHWKLLYKASIDGFDAPTFHAKCDGKGENFCVVKSDKGYIFGGYSSLSWNSIGNYQADPKAFLFSFVNSNGKQKVKIPQGSNQTSFGGGTQIHSKYCHPSYGPTFGGGHDLLISSNKSGSSSIGTSYSLPNYGNLNGQNYLAGSNGFNISEIEVFGSDDSFTFPNLKELKF